MGSLPFLLKHTHTPMVYHSGKTGREEKICVLHTNDGSFVTFARKNLPFIKTVYLPFSVFRSPDINVFAFIYRKEYFQPHLPLNNTI